MDNRGQGSELEPWESKPLTLEWVHDRRLAASVADFHTSQFLTESGILLVSTFALEASVGQGTERRAV